MSNADNKQTAITFMQKLPDGLADWDKVSDDLEWWIQSIGTVTKDEIRQIAARIAQQTVKGEMFIDHVTADDCRVAIELHSRIEMTDGRLFENTYHFLFIFRDDKIIAVREHFDPAYARDFFGSEAQADMAGPAS